ncbi:hypothetical protein D3C86_1025930 [compost metagenome]
MGGVDLTNVQRAVAGRSGQNNLAVDDGQTRDLAAGVSQVPRGQQFRRARGADLELAHHHATVLDACGVKLVAVRSHGLDAVVSDCAELADARSRCSNGREAMNPAFAEGLHIAVPAARSEGARHRGLRASGDIDTTVDAERYGRRLVRRLGSAALSPLLNTLGVEDRDETVGQVGVCARCARNQGSDHGAGHRHAPVSVHGDRVAAGRRGRAQGPAGDNLACGIQLHQDHVALPLDRLGRRPDADVRHDPHGAVRAGGAGAHGLNALGQARFADLTINPEGLPGGIDRPLLELQDFVPALGARALDHIDGVRGGEGGEADLLERHALHGQRPLVRPGRQGYGLVAGLDDARLGRQLLAAHAGLDARRLQLAVDVIHHRLHGARRRSHIRQINRDGLVAASLLDRHGEFDVALEGGDFAGQITRMHRSGDILGRIARHGRPSLGLGLGLALNHAHAIELGRAQIGGDFSQPRVHPLGQLRAFQRRQVLLPGPISDGLQHGEALIHGEDLAIVAGRGALHVQDGVVFIDQASSAQGGAQQVGLALGLDRSGPGGGRLLLHGRRCARTSREGRGPTVQAQKIAVVDHSPTLLRSVCRQAGNEVFKIALEQRRLVGVP